MNNNKKRPSLFQINLIPRVERAFHSITKEHVLVGGAGRALHGETPGRTLKPLLLGLRSAIVPPRRFHCQLDQSLCFQELLCPLIPEILRELYFLLL